MSLPKPEPAAARAYVARPVVVDLHSHVLPGLDDGASDRFDSLAMARVAAAGGVRIMVGTPHLRADHPEVRPEELGPRAAALSAFFLDERLPVKVLPGAEVSLESAAELDDDTLRLASLGHNGRDLLVETPYGDLPRDFEGQVGALQRRGFRLTLAHPERNPSFQRRPRRLGRLVRSGVLVQVTAGAVDHPRSASRALALLAIRQEWAHVIASDAHDESRRPSDLAGAVARGLEALPDAEAVLEWMITAAPLAIVEGRELPPRPKTAARGLRGFGAALRGGQPFTMPDSEGA